MPVSPALSSSSVIISRNVRLHLRTLIHAGRFLLRRFSEPPPALIVALAPNRVYYSSKSLSLVSPLGSRSSSLFSPPALCNSAFSSSATNTTVEVQSTEHEVVISLGSIIGNRMNNFKEALRLMKHNGICVTRHSCNFPSSSEQEIQNSSFDDGLVMTDVRNVASFGSMDFGWSEPVNMRFLMFQESFKNMVMILGPSKLDPAMEGGVRVVVTLPRDAMVKFKQEMDVTMHLRPRSLLISSSLLSFSSSFINFNGGQTNKKVLK